MKKFLMAAAGVALMSATALADGDMFEVYSVGGSTTAKGTYGSFAAAWAACEDYGKIKVLRSDADAITVVGRHVTLEVDSAGYDSDITVGANAELSFDGRTQGAIMGTITINGTNSELFVDGGTVGKVVVRDGYALVNYTTVTTIEQHGGSLQVEYSTVETLTADGDSSLTLGVGNKFTTTPNVADTVKRDDYEWTEVTSANAVRMRLDGGIWTEYATFATAVGKMGTTAKKIEIELLRNASMAKILATSGFAHDVDITIRSDSRGTKRYVLRRTGNYYFSANPSATSYTHKLRFENIVLDGGAIWTNPFHTDINIKVRTQYAAALANTGIAYSKAKDYLLYLENHPYVTFGSGTEIRNVQSKRAIYSVNGYELCFESGSRMTSNRMNGGTVVDMGSSSNAKVVMNGGRFDRNFSFSGSLLSVINTATSDSVFLTNGVVIVRNLTTAQTVYLQSYLALRGATICGNASAASPATAVYNDKRVTLSGHPIVRNNFTNGCVAVGLGLQIAEAAHVDGVLDWGAYVETGGSMDKFTYTTGASGFDHIVSLDKTKVGTAAASNKVAWGTPKLFVSVGENQNFSGDIASGLLKFQFDGAFNAGSCTVNGNLTAGTFSIGAPYDAVKRYQTRNFYVPLLTATSVDLSLLSVDVPLPEGWHLAKSTVQGGEELRLVYNPTGGLVIFVDP